MRQWSRMALAVGILAMAMAGGVAQGKLFVGWDLDSCADGCQVAIEGEITKVVDEKLKLVEVRVGRVYRAGEAGVKEKDALDVSLGMYQKPTGKAFDGPMGADLAVGDKLIMFLQKDVNPGAVRWNPLPGGIMLIVNGHVAEFSQHAGNPGPVLAETEAEYVKRGQPTLEEYRTRVDEAFKRVGGIREKLKTATEKKDAGALVELLRQREALKVGETRWGSDMVTKAIGEALAATHDVEALDSVVDLPKVWWSVAAGFSTPEGSEHVLKKVGDTQTPAEKRVKYARVLVSPSLAYQGEAEAVNRHYVARVAKLTEEHGKDAELYPVLLRQMEGWGQQMQRGAAGLREDRDEAVALLAKWYAGATDEVMRYRIELTTCRMSQEAYETLGSKCGPIIAILQLPAHPEQYGKPKERTVLVQYDYAAFFEENTTRAVGREAVLEAVDGGKEYVGTSTARYLEAGHAGSGGGSDEILIPAGVPKGKYRLYYRWTIEGKKVGQSHYVEVEL